MEIILKAKKPWTGESLAKRLGLIVNGSDWIEWSPDSRRWQVGQGNDWWLSAVDGAEDGTFSFRYRYGDPWLMNALGQVAFRRLNLVEMVSGPETPRSVRFKAAGYDAKRMAERVCQIVDGDKESVWKANEHDDSVYHIGTANDLILKAEGRDVYDLRHRYTGDALAAIMPALVRFVGIEPLS